MSNNNTSLFAIGLAAILMVGSLTGALIMLSNNNGNVNDSVTYAPDTMSELRSFAYEISDADSDTTMYSALNGMRFTDVNGRSATISSVDSLASYLSTLGYYLDTDGSDSRSLVPFTANFDDALYLRAAAFMRDTVESFRIDTISAATFASYGFARSTIFTSDTTLDDIMDVLRDSNDDVLLSDCFLGCRYSFATNAIAGRVVADSISENFEFGLLNESAMRSGNGVILVTTQAVAPSSIGVISSSSDLLEALMSITYGNLDFNDTAIFFASSSNFADDGSLYTVGQLSSFLDNQVNSAAAYAY